MREIDAVLLINTSILMINSVVLLWAGIQTLKVVKADARADRRV